MEVVHVDFFTHCFVFDLKKPNCYTTQSTKKTESMLMWNKCPAFMFF